MGRTPMVRQRGRERVGVLGPVRVCKFDMDTRGTDQLESGDGAELGVCWGGLCG